MHCNNRRFLYFRDFLISNVCKFGANLSLRRQLIKNAIISGIGSCLMPIARPRPEIEKFFKLPQTSCSSFSIITDIELCNFLYSTNCSQQFLMVLFSCVNTIEQLLIHQVAPLWLVCHPDFYMSYRLSDFCRDFVKGGGIPLQCTGVGPERKTFENLRAPAHLSSLIVRLPLLSSVFVLRAAR